MNLGGFAIAGIQGMTGLDFPGLVSALVFTQGCNFHCPYCHNAHLIPLPSHAPLYQEAASERLAVPVTLSAPLEDALVFLQRRAKVLDGLVISGGEPTLQPGLAGFCQSARALGYKIKLDTNGSRPGVIRQLLDAKLLDYVAVDCKTLPERYYPELCHEEDVGSALRETLSLLRAAKLPYELRTTCVAPFVGSTEIAGLADLLSGLQPELQEAAPWFLQKAELTPAMREYGLASASPADMECLAALARGKGARVKIR